MYSTFQMAAKYLRYLIKADNGKGHGIHSPFVFDFVTKVLNDKRKYPVYDKIETLRRKLRRNHQTIEVEDFGAGSVFGNKKQRQISSIAVNALKPKKYGQLMNRMVNYYLAKTVVELGTSLGITTCYLASANCISKIYTFEGSEEIAAVAKSNFELLHLHNIELVKGNFDETLATSIHQLRTIDFAFVDGNHRKEPTIRYFELLLEKINDQSVIIFDDIHWSKEMEEAWEYIKEHPSVSLSIDLFFIGIVFFRKEQKVPQHFTIRF